MKMSRRRWIWFVLGDAAFFVIFIVLVISLLVQMYVRGSIREVKSRVEPVSFAKARTGAGIVVGEADLFLFCLKNGDIVPARDAGQRQIFAGSILSDFPVGTNRIFIVIDSHCQRKRSQEIMDEFAKACTNTIYVVGSLSNAGNEMVCEKWKGSWDTMSFVGDNLDCSVVDSLFYVSPFVCNAFLGWFADRLGAKYERQKPWRARSERISTYWIDADEKP